MKVLILQLLVHFVEINGMVNKKKGLLKDRCYSCVTMMFFTYHISYHILPTSIELGYCLDWYVVETVYPEENTGLLPSRFQALNKVLVTHSEAPYRYLLNHESIYIFVLHFVVLLL